MNYVTADRIALWGAFIGVLLLVLESANVIQLG